MRTRSHLRLCLGWRTKFGREWLLSDKLFFAFVAGGILLRLLLTVFAGGGVFTPWRAGGDAPFYVQLASNVACGKGFAYYGGASAFRPPLYPLFLAAMMRLFSSSAFLVIRALQFAAGLVTVELCARTTLRMFGYEAACVARVIALFLPTLVVPTTELMTECFATLLVAMFFNSILFNPALSKRSTAALLGLIVGLATLLRFNMAILGVVALVTLALGAKWSQAWRRMCLLIAVAGLVVAPWVVRNLIVFQGHVILSTQGGINAVQGVLTPQGRAQGNDAEVLQARLGWQASDLESNEPARKRLASEPDLDRQAWAQAFALWRQENWRLIPLSLRKLGYFWLSTDQVFWTRSFSPRQRVLRFCAVLTHWCVLVLALLGWLQLRKGHHSIFVFLAEYAVLVSLVHLPFIMTSRYRVPLLETLLVVLASGGMAMTQKRIFVSLAWRRKDRNDSRIPYI